VTSARQPDPDRTPPGSADCSPRAQRGKRAAQRCPSASLRCPAGMRMAWLVRQAYESLLHAIEADVDVVKTARLAKPSDATLAESVLMRLCRVMGGGSYSRSSPFGHSRMSARSASSGRRGAWPMTPRSTSAGRRPRHPSRPPTRGSTSCRRLEEAYGTYGDLGNDDGAVSLPGRHLALNIMDNSAAASFSHSGEGAVNPRSPASARGRRIRRG
jgi:hypothetical protein